MKNLTLYIGVAATMILTSAPAFAGGVPTPTVPLAVPEPGTLGLIAGAAVAAIIAARIARRK